MDTKINEQAFVENFTNCFAQLYDENSVTTPRASNQSTYTDCEVILENEVVKIEAKLLNDNGNNSSNFYNLLGEIIGAIKKDSCLKKVGRDTKKECLAFLIPASSKETFDKLWEKNIGRETGQKYCNSFNVKYLITFDTEKQRITKYSFNPELNLWE